MSDTLVDAVQEWSSAAATLDQQRMWAYREQAQAIRESAQRLVDAYSNKESLQHFIYELREALR